MCPLQLKFIVSSSHQARLELGRKLRGLATPRQSAGYHPTLTLFARLRGTLGAEASIPAVLPSQPAELEAQAWRPCRPEKLTGFERLLTPLGTTDSKGRNPVQALARRRNIFLQRSSIDSSAQGVGLLLEPQGLERALPIVMGWNDTPLPPECTPDNAATAASSVAEVGGLSPLAAASMDPAGERVKLGRSSSTAYMTHDMNARKAARRPRHPPDWTSGPCKPMRFRAHAQAVRHRREGPHPVCALRQCVRHTAGPISIGDADRRRSYVGIRFAGAAQVGEWRRPRLVNHLA